MTNSVLGHYKCSSSCRGYLPHRIKFKETGREERVQLCFDYNSHLFYMSFTHSEWKEQIPREYKEKDLVYIFKIYWYMKLKDMSHKHIHDTTAEWRALVNLYYIGKATSVQEGKRLESGG